MDKIFEYGFYVFIISVALIIVIELAIKPINSYFREKQIKMILFESLNNEDVYCPFCQSHNIEQKEGVMDTSFFCPSCEAQGWSGGAVLRVYWTKKGIKPVSGCFYCLKG